MELIPLLSAILVTTAVFAWINHRLLHLPPTIGVMVVALGMSVPALVGGRDALVTVTYVVVVFSILVQGLTIGRLVASRTRAA